MNYCIIIRGPLGSGKSTISEKLAQILNAKHIKMDDVLKQHGLDKISSDIQCVSIKNFIRANKIVLPEAKELLIAGKIVIFDACFYHKEVIENLVKNIQFPHYIFTLKASPELCIKRDSKRSKSYGEDATRAVYSLVSQFDYGTLIDANKNLEDSIGDILTCLPSQNKH